MCHLGQWEDDLPMDEDFDETPGNDTGAVARQQHLFNTGVLDLLSETIRLTVEVTPRLVDLAHGFEIAVIIVGVLFLVTLIYAIFFK